MLTTIHLTLRARSRWIRLLRGVFRGAVSSRPVGDIVNCAAAHRRRLYETAHAAGISGSYLFVGHQEGADDRHVLVLSAFGQANEGVVDIAAKPIWPNVIDAAVAAQHTSGSNDRYTINSGKTERHVSDEPPSDGDQA